MRISWVVFAGLVVAGCQGPEAEVASTSQAIVAGAMDTGDPAIMEVLSFRGNLGARCTATLVTPRVLLLAAHCFAETAGFPQRFVFPGNDDRNAPDKDMIPLKTFGYDPQYTMPRQGHDFAVAVLEAPLAARPLPINRAPLDKAQGKSVRYVGYGLDVVGNPSAGGVKRQNTAPLATVSALLLSIAPNAHPACEGDSGGPLLFDDGNGESIIGVGSFVTNPACQRDSFYQRLDTQTAWLNEQIKKYDPPGAAPADAGAGDGGAPDAEVPADAQAAEVAAPPMQSPADARPHDALSAPVMEPEPEPTVTKTASGGCSYGGGASGSAVLLLALFALASRPRRRV